MVRRARPDPRETATQPSARRSVEALRITVRIMGVFATPSSFALERTCRIGAGEENDIVIDDPKVSRTHVELERVAEGVLVRDLDSTNGTYYLGQRIASAILAVGTRFQIGPVTAAIELDDDALRAGLAYDGNEYRGLSGGSAAMHRLFALLSRIESSLAPVLVEGESGVGKERVARALHDGSSVAAGPMVSLNCGALPRELVASELFGHRRGAFTGAAEARRGAFESADGGTLFLDEIGELPLDLQPTLLRVLETGEVRRLGDEAPIRVAVRIVAATNRDLEDAVRQGTFREDLFFRLAVLRVTVPPLRERPDDIELLAQEFAQASVTGALPQNVIEQLRVRAWPGNVRELRNAVEAYRVLGVLPKATRSRPATLALSLRESIDGRAEYAPQKEAFLDRFTATYLELLLETAGGNQSVAAKIAGLDRSYLGRLLAKHGLIQRE
jgi:DNA-binding NtrC family response regulator